MIIKKPQILIVSGHPGSGKTTLANNLAEKLGWPVLSHETIASALAMSLPGGDGARSAAAISVILAQAEQVAMNGNRVIVDFRGNLKDFWPDFERIKMRRPMVRYLPIFLQTDFDTCEQRLGGRITKEALLKDFETYSNYDFQGLIKMEARRPKEEIFKNAVALVYANLLA